MTSHSLLAGACATILAALALLVSTAPSPARASALTLKELYQESVTQKCTTVAASLCEWKFAFVPAGKFLHVTHVSCRFIFEPTGAYTMYDARVAVRKQSGGSLVDRYNTLTPVLLSNKGTKRIWILNNQTSHLVDAVERPIVVISLNGAAHFLPEDNDQKCTVSGVLRNL